MEIHSWKEKTEDGTMMFRASHHAGKWKLECAPKVGRSEKDFVEWEVLEFNKDRWETLRDILWRKYQRKRCPWKLIEAIDKTLEDLSETSESDQD